MVIKGVFKNFALVLLALIPVQANAFMADLNPNDLLQALVGGKPGEYAPLASSLVGSDGNKSPIHTDPNTISAFAAENLNMAMQGASMAVKGVGPQNSYSSLGMGIVQNIVRLGQQGKSNDKESSFASQKEGGGGGGSPTLAQAHRVAYEDAILRINNRKDEPTGLIVCTPEVPC